jgi:hypothetical protein
MWERKENHCLNPQKVPAASRMYGYRRFKGETKKTAQFSVIQGKMKRKLCVI